MKVQLSFDEETMNSTFPPKTSRTTPPLVTRLEFMARDAVPGAIERLEPEFRSLDEILACNVQCEFLMGGLVWLGNKRQADLESAALVEFAV